MVVQIQFMFNMFANLMMSCENIAIYGCTDSNYAEFDENANVDDGSCENEQILVVQIQIISSLTCWQIP